VRYEDKEGEEEDEEAKDGRRIERMIEDAMIWKRKWKSDVWLESGSRSFLKL
jgi:hypothetical protein